MTSTTTVAPAPLSRSSAEAGSAARVMTSGFHGCDESPLQRESVLVHLTRSQLNPTTNPRRS
jgi:hypothetical protein